MSRFRIFWSFFRLSWWIESHVLRSTSLAILFLACANFVITVTAVNKLTLTWQPISSEDLSLKDNPADPGEDAMSAY
jgi:hypothetical protein